MKLNISTTLAVSSLLLSTLTISTASAQNGTYYDRNNGASDYVTLYEHCDFRGKSRDVLVGEFRNMRSVSFDNDSVSSVRVPRGMDLVVYQDDDFRGGQIRFDQDAACFGRQWNDRVSSLRVRYSSDNGHRRGNDRNHTNNNRGYDDRNNNDRRRGDENVSAETVSQVYFDNKVLQQTSATNWSLNRAGGGPQGILMQFKEVRRDQNSVYLQNDYTAEKVRIDAYANKITMTDRDGRKQFYSIQLKQALMGTRPPVPVTSRSEPSRRIAQECFDYRATSRGGEASVRFDTRESLKRFNNSTVTGRVCHKGSLTMEIAKRNPSTDVSIKILGRDFRFVPNEQEDELKNSWYRKRVRLKVGR